MTLFLLMWSGGPGPVQRKGVSLRVFNRVLMTTGVRMMLFKWLLQIADWARIVGSVLTSTVTARREMVS